MGLRARRGLSIALLTLSALAGSAQAEPPAGEATVPAAPPPPPLAAAPPPAAAAPPPAIAAVSVWRDGAVKALPLDFQMGDSITVTLSAGSVAALRAVASTRKKSSVSS